MILLKLILVLSVSLGAFGIIGRFLFKFLSKQELSVSNAFNLFIFYLTGYLTTASVVGIIFSSGLSIQWLVLIPTILLIRLYTPPKFSDHLVRKNSLFHNLGALTSITAITLLYSLFCFGFKIEPEHLISDFDDKFYAKLAKQIIESGKESFHSIHNLYFDTPNFSLYHLTDLWLSGFISKLSGLSNLNTYLFISLNIPIILCMYFIYSVVSWSNKYHILTSILASVIILFGIKLILPIEHNSYQYFSSWYDSAILRTPVSSKHFHVIPIALLLFLFIREKQATLASLLLVICIAVFNTLIPSLCFAGGLFLLLAFINQLYQTKNFARTFKTYLPSLIILGCSILTILAMNKYLVDGELIKTTSKTITSIKTYLIKTIEFSVSSWIYTPILLILGGLSLWKNRRFSNYSPLLFYFFGTVGATIFILVSPNLSNVGQAIRNFVAPFSIALGIILACKERPTNFIILILLLGVFYNIKFILDHKPEDEYELSFKQEVLDQIKNSPGKRWAIIDNYSLRWSFNNPLPGQFIMNLKETDYPIDLSKCFKFSDTGEEWCNQNFNHPCCNCEKELNLAEVLNKYNINFLFIEGIDEQIEVVNDESKIKLISQNKKTKSKFYKISKDIQ